MNSNEQILHFGPYKSDEDIIKSSNYLFTQDINILLSNSINSRRAKRYKRGLIRPPPRPQNAWIIYRRDKSANPIFSKMRARDASKIISKMWEKEPNEVKQLFGAMARIGEKKHIGKFGIDYKYQPETKKKTKEYKINKNIKMSIKYITNH